MSMEFSGSMGMYDNRMRIFGANNMFDTKALLDSQLQIMELQNQPLKTRQQAYSGEKQVWTSFQKTLSDFNKITDELRKANLSEKKVAVQPSGFVNVTANGGALDGNYNIQVQQLATYHKIMGDSVFADAKKQMGIEASLLLNGKELELTKDMSLTDLARSINEGDFKTNAVIISGHLILTSKETGVANKITFGDALGDVTTASVSNTDILETKVVGSSANGTYNVSVSQLATRHAAESGEIENANEALGKTGSFTINGQSFDVEEGDSVRSIVEKINAAEELGVKAKMAGGKFVLEASESGAEKRIVLEDPDAIFSSIGLTDENGQFAHVLSEAQDAVYTVNGESFTSETNTATLAEGIEITLKETSDDSVTVTVTQEQKNVFAALGLVSETGEIKNEVQEAKDAKYSIDGISLTSASNEIHDAVDGLSFELLQETASNVNFTVEKDFETLKEKMNKFVENYNNMIRIINQLTQQEGDLQGQMIPTQAKTVMNRMLMQSSPSGMMFYEIGLTMNGSENNGTVSFDELKFEEKMNEDPEAILEMMTGAESPIQTLYDRLYDIAGPTGTISNTIKGLDDRINDINKSIERAEENFAIQRESMLRKYAQFEIMMTELNQSSVYMEAQLESLSGGGNK